MGDSTGAYTVLMQRLQGKKPHLEDTKVDGRITLKWISQEVGFGRGGMDWIDLAQDKDKWRALVIGVMNLRFL
jgi:hypothetical protein